MSPVVAVPNEDEINIKVDGEGLVIYHADSSGKGAHADVAVYRDNLAVLIIALRRIDGQEP